MKPVAIFAATRWELRALHRAFPTFQVSTIADLRCLVGEQAGQSYWLIQTGVGPESAGRVAKSIMNRQSIRAVVSAGFACALEPAQVGDLIVGTESLTARRRGDWEMQDDVVQCDRALRERTASAAQQAGLAVRGGRFVSVETVVWQAEDKRRLSRLSGAVALDMESAALGAAASRQGVPFAIVRTVSDLVDEDLPVDFNHFLRPVGWLNGIQALLAHPSSLLGLNRLRKQSCTAAERLTEVFARYAAAGVAAGEVGALS